MEKEIDNTLQFKTFEIKEQTVDKQEFTAIISTSDVDLDDEVMLPDGLNMKEFKKNPIILFNHNKDLPIGKALSIRKSGNGMIAKAKLGENIDRINDIWKLVKQGILKGISVGFIANEIRIPTPQDIKLFGKKVKRVISKWTLLEVSVVSVPANQNALIQSCKSLNIDPKVIIPDYKEEKKGIDRELIEQIKSEIKKSENRKELKNTIKEELIKNDLIKNGIIYY